MKDKKLLVCKCFTLKDTDYAVTYSFFKYVLVIHTDMIDIKV